MSSLLTLAQALGLAFASGISVYATVALVGIAQRWGLVSGLPSPLEAAASPWIVWPACVLTVVEFLATMIPGLASAWDAVHSLVRPPAAALMAVLVAWHGDATFVLAAGLLGGTLGLATHATKLGARVVVDTSPELLTNGVANATELTTVALVVLFVWRHPFVTLAAALAMLVAVWWVGRGVWRTVLALRIPTQTPPRTSARSHPDPAR